MRPSDSEARLTYERLRRLQAMTAALSWSMTREQIGQVVLQSGLDALEVRAAGLSLQEPDGALVMFAHTGYRSEQLRHHERIDADARHPLHDAIRHRAPLFFGDRGEIEVRYPHLKEVVRLDDDHAWAAIPMFWDGAPLGSMGLSFAQPRVFAEDDRDFLVAVAQQCAGALMRISHFSLPQLLREMTPDELLELRRAIDRRLRDR